MAHRVGARHELPPVPIRKPRPRQRQVSLDDLDALRPGARSAFGPDAGVRSAFAHLDGARSRNLRSWHRPKRETQTWPRFGAHQAGDAGGGALQQDVEQGRSEEAGRTGQQHLPGVHEGRRADEWTRTEVRREAGVRAHAREGWFRRGATQGGAQRADGGALDDGVRGDVDPERRLELRGELEAAERVQPEARKRHVRSDDLRRKAQRTRRRGRYQRLEAGRAHVDRRAHQAAQKDRGVSRPFSSPSRHRNR